MTEADDGKNRSYEISEQIDDKRRLQVTIKNTVDLNRLANEGVNQMLDGEYDRSRRIIVALT